MAGGPDETGSTDDIDAELERPYPLARNFYLRLLPALLVFLLGLIVVTGLALREATEDVYLARAVNTVRNIAADVASRAPQPWQKLMAGERIASRSLDQVSRALGKEQIEYKLVGLKVYDLTGRTLYSHNPHEIGELETGQALREVIAGGEPSAIGHTEGDGTKVYELYLPYKQGGRLVAVFELYESLSGGFSTMVRKILVPVLALLAGLLAILIALFVPVIRGAQAAITARTEAITDMRQRIERLVSRGGARAMRRAEFGEQPPHKQLEVTLFYSDARGFTAFSELSDPERAINVLNRLIGVQLDIVEQNGGDVDKIIGDAVFAVFEGDGRETRAVQAAIAIQRRLTASDLPLRVGIGVYSGSVIAGTIGTRDRLDYTVVGDSVNVAARLCSAAGENEIIADEPTVAKAGLSGFGDTERISVKGREQAINTRCWRPDGTLPKSSHVG